ncbi:hypothetical protein [Staphylococcus carnosus]|uniref:hypothetical protein n=1 Tax=Staphylococcus carnosus TaxID=1281 RepID=UPI000A63A2FE|nr:hypothetical protein [Staphylococcus carnosus]GEP80277.1 hypothetical protein SCA05_20700 [Staphylococcus carnosus]SUM04783.1 putative DNA binding protein [Staphylococcus carnosus]
MDKSTRVLNIFTRLLNGETVRKSDLSEFGNVSTKSIQRDVRTINDFFMKVNIGIIEILKSCIKRMAMN